MRPSLIAVAAALVAGAAFAMTPQERLLQTYASQAGVEAFAAERGRAFFLAEHEGGKPETPSCTTCHRADITQPGQTRAGKPIEPLAVAANPERLTDPAFVEKWLGRNCRSVLGRDCTPQEKGDVVAFLAGL